jgi:hypothetical protein
VHHRGYQAQRYVTGQGWVMQQRAGGLQGCIFCGLVMSAAPHLLQCCVGVKHRGWHYSNDTG